jgi:penicillin-binding protein 2
VIRLVQQGLRDVTKEGTAAGVFGAGFPVDIAGKTGTAENSQGADHGWFVAYGPFADPNIVVAVIVENGGFGSQSAVPIGKRILEAAFGLDGSIPFAEAPGNRKR